jgi:hypothetical protein
MRHLPRVAKYGRNLLGARSAVLAILEQFNEYGIHATWAVVGFLFADSGRTLREYAPQLRPQYSNAILSPYLDLPPDDARETAESIFFAPSLIRRIASVANQEIGTHTFSHYYCLEAGQHADAFRADLTAARDAAHRFGIDLKSLVFPKNQYRADFLEVCAEAGIIAYRGNQRSWLHSATSDQEQGLARRVGRLLDAYVPLSRGNCHSLPAPASALPLDIPASRFLRPFSPALRSLEELRLARIKREMSFAARERLLYHLWWHPHNFGVDQDTNVGFLRRILDHFQALNIKYGMESVNMRETAERLLRPDIATPAYHKAESFELGVRDAKT